MLLTWWPILTFSKNERIEYSRMANVGVVLFLFFSLSVRWGNVVTSLQLVWINNFLEICFPGPRSTCYISCQKQEALTFRSQENRMNNKWNIVGTNVWKSVDLIRDALLYIEMANGASVLYTWNYIRNKEWNKTLLPQWLSL